MNANPSVFEVSGSIGISNVFSTSSIAATDEKTLAMTLTSLLILDAGTIGRPSHITYSSVFSDSSTA